MNADNPALAQLKRYLPAALSVVVFSLAMLALHRLAGEFHLNDVRAAFRTIPTSSFALALFAAAASYAALTQYERLAVRHVGSNLAYSRIALTSFIAYAVGHNVGVSALSGGAIRYRLYSAAGLSATQITQIIALGSLTFALGATTLTGIALITDADVAAPIMRVSSAAATLIGVLLLLAIASYLLFCGIHREPLTLRGWTIQLPQPSLGVRQITVASVDLLCACGALYALLSAAHDISFWGFAGVFIVAIGAGVISAVPGGLGVFESVVILLLPNIPPADLLAVMLGYRLIYYALPFLLAIVLLSVNELRAQTAQVTRFRNLATRSLGLIAPQAIAFLVFGAGLLLLLSGSTPAIETRLQLLSRLLPLAVLELSHLAGSAIGVAMLILARGLYRRLDGAWHLTIWLLVAGIAASLLKGLDWEEAVFLAAVVVTLVITRREFYRRTSLLAGPVSPGWISAMFIAVGASIATTLLAYRAVPYGQELWWQFAIDASAPRAMRGAMLGAILAGGYALVRLIGPTRSPPAAGIVTDTARVAQIVRLSDDSNANLALLGDKQLLFSESASSFIMYATSGHSWVAMGDPVGLAVEREELVWKFRDLADRAGRTVAFYEVSPDALPAYIDAGLSLSKLGEEARVALSGFTLAGSARAELRQAHRRGQREGLQFQIVPATEFDSRRDELQAISSEWLSAKRVAEKGFSLGYFDAQYLRQFPTALVLLNGRIVAFANIWDTDSKTELSIDLMRHSNAAPRGTMDFLFVELMLWGSKNSYQWFNLGMAPLSGLEAHRLAPAWHKLGRLVYRFGAEFYNFDGLRNYKDKFNPVWRPRYLAAPGRLALARVLYDVTRLISRGTSI
ncbi:MAG: bifunctional lysylphosphatidylglycerol flippase/synthetase MprF [Proteobacteria bacterium]|nr:bifunctional lysylphosphatidylglycerol flippase/synthetase MprF [Pseudomonadota bacterium]